MNRKIKMTILGAVIILLAGFQACEIEEMVDPNGPSLEASENNATISDLKNIATGIESEMRNRLGTYFDALGITGREFYRFSGSDPRFTTELLGKGSIVLDNNTFYTSGPWSARYRVIRNAYILINAVNNSTADISNEERSGVLGFANTIIAYQLLLCANMQHDNGIRIDVADPDNMGPLTTSHDASLTAIAALLNEADTQLKAAGDDDLLIDLSSGFSGYQTTSGFLMFNRAIAARVAAYRGNYSEALTALNESFFDLNGDFYEGVYHLFSTAGGDKINEMYYPANASAGTNTRVAHNSFVADADPLDNRISDKVTLHLNDEDAASPATQDGLSGDYALMVYNSTSDPISIIRNEELILIYAEANIAANPAEAVIAINIIRSTWGLNDYTGGTTEAELIDEILIQRRYSLFAEGHRWIDMRRFGKLTDLPIDRTNDDVWERFPIPAAENE